MKPRIFIGSSTERLELAYAIQESLEYDAQSTVWTQGIFKLSSSALDSLVSSLDGFDFAVFVFHPDDVTQIRDSRYETVRDNLIFELGLFIGKLGKDRVFFLVPRNIIGLHLPTDLLGIMPGTYDNARQDNNLLASLGPFCNQVRKTLNAFVFENVEDIQNEPKYIKQIVVESKVCWEYLFAAELLRERLIEINKSYEDIESGIVIRRLNAFTGTQFFDWFRNSLANFQNFIFLFGKCVDELVMSFGPAGVAGKPIEIKNAVERLIQLCRELLSWEYELHSINPPTELAEVKRILKGLTKTMFIDELNTLNHEIKEFVEKYRQGSEDSLTLTLAPKVPEILNTIMDRFQAYFDNPS